MNIEKLWDQYAQNNIGWIEEWIDIDSHDFQGKVPSSWIQLVNTPSSITVQEIWKTADNAMPRFLDYLSYAIIEARIALTKVGYVLVYHLKEWLENYTDIPLYGFMAAGLPATEKDLKHFERNLGKLPISIRNLWLTHGFIQRRDESFLTSVVNSQQRLAQAPYPYLNREDNWQENHFLDCLAIANVNGEIVPGLSKSISSNEWEDNLVIIMRYDKGFTKKSVDSIDDWLTDAAFLTWLNPGWEQ
jgi:hypothetical protein